MSSAVHIKTEDDDKNGEIVLHPVLHRDHPIVGITPEEIEAMMRDMALGNKDEEKKKEEEK